MTALSNILGLVTTQLIYPLQSILNPEASAGDPRPQAPLRAAPSHLCTKQQPHNDNRQQLTKVPTHTSLFSDYETEVAKRSMRHWILKEVSPMILSGWGLKIQL